MYSAFINTIERDKERRTSEIQILHSCVRVVGESTRSVVTLPVSMVKPHITRDRPEPVKDIGGCP